LLLRRDFWGASPSRMGRGTDYTSGNLGSIYVTKITPDAYRNAQAGFYFFYWFRAGEWPDKNPNLSGAEMAREIYLRLMLIQKANDLGIYSAKTTLWRQPMRCFIQLDATARPCRWVNS